MNPTTTLNEAQQAAVASNSPNIIIVAAPGSGKTRVLISRIQRLIDDGANPQRLAAITFTNAAAQEIQSRLGRPIGYVGTLHSFMLRLIQQHHAQLGYASPTVAVLDEDQTDDLMERAAKEVNYRGPVKRMREIIAGIEPKLFDASIAVQRFHVLSRTNNLICYDQILAAGLELVRSGVPVKFDHLFVDEVQDAADIDWQIYDALPIANKFHVGDFDQSIFGWRGARVQNFVDRARQNPERVIVLDQNYRSDRSICEAAQNLIRHNPNRLDKQMAPVSELPGVFRVEHFKGEIAERLHVLNPLPTLEGSTAILLRTNKLVDLWTDTLTAAGIPVQTRRQVKRPPDWPLLKTAVGVLNDPANDYLCHALMELMMDRSQADAIWLQARAQGASLNDFRLHTPPNLELTAYGPFLAKLGLSRESLELLNETMDRMHEGSTGSDLLLALSAEPEEQPVTIGTGPAVTVCTIHGAKGREWANVFLPAFEQEIIPGTAKSRNIEEERRLAYVAMTRAKHNLFVSYCQERKPQFGSHAPLPVHPSQFIAETSEKGFSNGHHD